jgi:hypothetical protein
MTATATILQERLDDGVDQISAQPVGGPVSAGWREATLTRAKELEALSGWILRSTMADGATRAAPDREDLVKAVALHIAAARDAAENRGWFRLPHKAARVERAMSNLDAAEAHLMQVAPPGYVLGQLPSVLNHVECHLRPSDARRKHFESIATRVGVKEPDSTQPPATQLSVEEKWHEVELERAKIVCAMRAASSAALREQIRLHSFRNVVVATTILLTLLVGGFAVMGALEPAMIPLCFQPEAGGEVTVVCPTGQLEVGRTLADSSPSLAAVDGALRKAVSPLDLLAVEAVGLAAAAVAAAAAIRNIRGSSERYGLPVALALLKLPTGAMTAVLGLLLMRGEFIPGLSALDSSGQIIAWALVFGYAQQLFTRMVDQQAHTVLDGIRTPKDDPAPSPTHGAERAHG